MFSWLLYYSNKLKITKKTIKINFATNIKIIFVKKLINFFANYIQLVCPNISTAKYKIDFFIITSNLFLRKSIKSFNIFEFLS